MGQTGRDLGRLNIAFIAILAIIIAIQLILTFIGPHLTGFFVARTQAMSLEGYTPVSIDLSDNSLILTGECRSLSLGITPDQAQSIASGLAGGKPFRPTTHDLMEDINSLLAIKVIHAKVTGFSDGAYMARLVMIQGGKVLDLDARPSDAIALAIREGAPVYVSTALLNKHGANAC